MTKAQKIIVLAAAILIILAWLFPPYWEGVVDGKGKLTGVYLKWEFDKNLRDLINPPLYVNANTGWSSIMIWEYTAAEDVQGIEFLFVLVIAGATFLFAKKRGSVGKGMTKTQKVIVMTAAFLIMVAVIYPPFYSQFDEGEWSSSGWKSIVNLVEHRENVPKIRFDVLFLEIFGILVLAGAALLITKKAHRN